MVRSMKSRSWAAKSTKASTVDSKGKSSTADTDISFLKQDQALGVSPSFGLEEVDEESDRLRLDTDALIAGVCEVVEKYIRAHHWKVIESSSDIASDGKVIESSSDFTGQKETSDAHQGLLRSQTRLELKTLQAKVTRTRFVPDTLDTLGDANAEAPNTPGVSKASGPGQNRPSRPSVHRSFIKRSQSFNRRYLEEDNPFEALVEPSMSVVSPHHPSYALIGQVDSPDSPTPDAMSLHEALEQMVNSQTYGKIYATVICISALLVCINLEAMFRRRTAEDDAVLHWILLATDAFFVIELILRMYVNGVEFFTSKRIWNYFDFVLVVLSTARVSQVVQHHIRNTRVLGAVRVFRVLRTLKLVRPLRLLMRAIFASFMECCWVMALLLTVVWGFSMVFATAVIQYLYGCPGCNGEQNPQVHAYFGTMFATLSTLFQAISGGVSWRDPVEALLSMGTIGTLLACLFHFYIAVVCYGVLNVITALFCQHAVEDAMSDYEAMLTVRSQRYHEMDHELRNIFYVLDAMEQSNESPEGMITLKELKESLKHAEMQARLAVIGLETDDAEMLFNLLNVQQNGVVSIDEFVSGCMRLRGEATKLDMQFLMYDVQFLYQKLKHLMQDN